MPFPERLRAKTADAPVEPAAAPTVDHSDFDALLSDYVDAGGRVDYAGLRGDGSHLDAYLAQLAAADPDELSGEERLAFYINAYNAATLDLIVDNYPLASITELDGGKPWDVERVELGGETYSLNQIENDLIRGRFDEPRIHFAVNCAAASCPPLRAGAYTAERLDEQLDEQTRDFLTDPDYITVSGGEARVSKIFDWYGADFESVSAFIARYREDVNQDTEIAFAEYDWSLNDQ